MLYRELGQLDAALADFSSRKLANESNHAVQPNSRNGVVSGLAAIRPYATKSRRSPGEVTWGKNVQSHSVWSGLRL